MKLPPLPAPYYWSSLDGDINIMEGPRNVPRDFLVNECRTQIDCGTIVCYVWENIIYSRDGGGFLRKSLNVETKEEAVQLMYNLFLLGELKGD